MDKRTRSEITRIEALAAKKQLEKERAALIRDSLKANNSKRKVFDNSDEESSNEERMETLDVGKAALNKSEKLGEHMNTWEGTDDRFQLDERFVEDENDDIPETSLVAVEETYEAEAKKTKRKKKSEDVLTEEVPLKVNAGQFYEMDNDFLQHLKQNAVSTKPSNRGFSFLEAIRRERIFSQQDASTSKNELILIKDPIAYNNAHSSSDEEENESGYGVDLKLADISTKIELKRLPFFFTGDEPEIRSVVSNFRRNQDEKKIEKVWTTYRQSIYTIVNHMKRNARRNIKERGLKYNYGYKKKETKESDEQA